MYHEPHLAVFSRVCAGDSRVHRARGGRRLLLDRGNLAHGSCLPPSCVCMAVYHERVPNCCHVSPFQFGCILVFTVEFVARVLVCPDLCKFWLSKDALLCVQ